MNLQEVIIKWFKENIKEKKLVCKEYRVDGMPKIESLWEKFKIIKDNGW